MDSLERQMEHQREQIQSTLERTMEGSDLRRNAIERLRSVLPGFSGRTPVRGAGEGETPTEPVRGGTPVTREESAREPSYPRAW